MSESSIEDAKLKVEEWKKSINERSRKVNIALILKHVEIARKYGDKTIEIMKSEILYKEDLETIAKELGLQIEKNNTYYVFS
jgi:hypothetical protein